MSYRHKFHLNNEKITECLYQEQYKVLTLDANIWFIFYSLICFVTIISMKLFLEWGSQENSDVTTKEKNLNKSKWERINSKLLFPPALELSSETEPPFGNTETDKLIWISELFSLLIPCNLISTASSLALHSSLCRFGQWLGFKMILLTSHTSESYFSSAELWDDSSGIKQFPTKQLMIRYDSMGPHTHPHLSWEVEFNWIWDTAGLWSKISEQNWAKSPYQT